MTNIDKARELAIKAHGDQKYGDKPYSYHLDEVAELLKFGGSTLMIIGYLHDTLEDTDLTKVEIESQFGKLVADCVDLLTDLPGANRKERKAKTYARLATISKSSEEALALIVKAADRLANIRNCIADDNKGLLKMYRAEHSAFTIAVYRKGLCDALWSELEHYCPKIDER